MKRPVSQIPDWMILDAFRYALGRMTFQVSITTKWLTDNLDHLSDSLFDMVWQELDEAIANDAKTRVRYLEAGGKGPKFFPLGQDCDRAEWTRLHTEMGNKMIKQSKTKGGS